MSVSLKSLSKISKLLLKKNMEVDKALKRDKSAEKSKSHLCLKNLFYKKADKINKDLCILNFISNETGRKDSMKTNLTDSFPIKCNYELCMINKYDESLHPDLSFISGFDLEEDFKKSNDSFNSSDNDDSEIEQIEIKTRTSKILFKNENDENDIELDKELDDIRYFLLGRKKIQ